MEPLCHIAMHSLVDRHLGFPLLAVGNNATYVSYVFMYTRFHVVHIILEAELLSHLVAMLSFLRILLCTYLCVFVCMCCAMVCVERVQPVGAGSFFPYGF